MRHTIIALALSTTMLLGGCATLGQPGAVGDIIAKVQQIAAQACGFVPIASTITAIVTAGQFIGAFEIANAICAAVTAPPPPVIAGAKAAKRTPTVSGVPIRGEFVKR